MIPYIKDNQVDIPKDEAGHPILCAGIQMDIALDTVVFTQRPT